MASSFFQWLRNRVFRTDVSASGVHTLIVRLG